ncbi:MAG: hypothetical protein AAF213_10380 [Pseudomonadota bacterium]
MSINGFRNAACSLALITLCALALLYQTPAQSQVPPQVENAPPIGLTNSQRLDPENVIKAYYTFISTGQFSSALDLLGPSFDVEPVREIASEIRELNRKIRSGEVAVALDQIKVEGDWAIAILVIDAEVGGEKKKIVADQYLLDLGDRWTIVPRQLRRDDSFRSFYNNNSYNLNTWWKNNQAEFQAKFAEE